MTAQSVILPLPSDHARFIVLRLKDLSIEELKEKLEDLFSTRDRLITQHPHAQIKTAVAFGPELWAQLHPTAPAGFKQLEPIYGSFNMPVSPADVLIHIASQRTDICFALSQSFFEGIQDKVDVLDERVCFRNFDGRDLTGFIDGTENPQFPDDRAATTLLRPYRTSIELIPLPRSQRANASEISSTLVKSPRSDSSYPGSAGTIIRAEFSNNGITNSK